ncbi:MAG: hypothetical protein ACYCOO_11555, partial [Chitinophagaceae bacterium]
KNFQRKFDKPTYYVIMASGHINTINEEINLLKEGSPNQNEAFIGALMMRKAGLLKLPGKKLGFFEAGRKKLDRAIFKDEKNVEYHFLRLMIQENAPKIVNYHNDLETDENIITKNFESLSPDVQQAIVDYAKHSKILQSNNFLLLNQHG